MILFKRLSCANLSSWRGSWVLLLAMTLSGCTRSEAPSFALLGSYFPSWLACAFIGVIAAVVARVLFIRVGIDEVLPWRLLIYVCLALAVAFICSLLLFAR
ncbi:similar to: Y. pestis YPO0620 putative exported protein [Yersinia frederiksenii]|nr:similar to: Y. pestis YPO0620 putative exported protein [Yersinia frederiksenii]